MGLAMVGGGVATTAGGVKLLRVYALYLHGQREVERLIHPSSVGRASGPGRRIRRQGAYIAWIFFMLFAMTLTALTAALALFGQDFEQALILALSGLSTTGPLIHTASEEPIRLVQLGPGPSLSMRRRWCWAGWRRWPSSRCSIRRSGATETGRAGVARFLAGNSGLGRTYSARGGWQRHPACGMRKKQGRVVNGF